MLEASLIASQLTDLHINERDQFLLYLRNLPDKAAEFVQLHCGATTVVAYHTRMRLTNDLDRCMWPQGQSKALNAPFATIAARKGT